MIGRLGDPVHVIRIEPIDGSVDATDDDRTQ
jgi:hypothetical protein